MALWLSSAGARSRERHVDLLQTEAHVQHLLQARGVEVVRADFRRTDARAAIIGARSAGRDLRGPRSRRHRTRLDGRRARA